MKITYDKKNKILKFEVIKKNNIPRNVSNNTPKLHINKSIWIGENYIMAKISKIVKVRNQSNSLMIAIPKIFTDALNITDQSKVSVTLEGEKLVVEVAKEENE